MRLFRQIPHLPFLSPRVLRNAKIQKMHVLNRSARVLVLMASSLGAGRAGVLDRVLEPRIFVSKEPTQIELVWRMRLFRRFIHHAQ